MPGVVKFNFVPKGGKGPLVYERSINAQSKFAQDLMAAGGKKTEAAIMQIASDAVARVNAYVHTNYERREGRRHKKGQRHLHDSFYALVNGQPPTGRRKYPTFPFDIQLRSTAPIAVVQSLNNGAKPHVIMGKGGKDLFFPVRGLGMSYTGRGRGGISPTTRTSPARVKAPLRFAKSPGSADQAKSKGRFVRTSAVNHPGIRPSYFMELSLEQAVNATLRKNVRLPRGKTTAKRR